MWAALTAVGCGLLMFLLACCFRFDWCFGLLITLLVGDFVGSCDNSVDDFIHILMLDGCLLLDLLMWI